MEHPTNVEHKTSTFLTKNENEQIFQLLGPNCQSIATTVVQMYSMDGPDGDHWITRKSVLCLVHDISKQSYFFRLFCLIKNEKVWEHEIYDSIQYLAPRSFLHTFEAEDIDKLGIVISSEFQGRSTLCSDYVLFWDCRITFMFSDQSEATLLREKLLNELKKMKEQQVSPYNKGHADRNLENCINCSVSHPNLNERCDDGCCTPPSPTLLTEPIIIERTDESRINFKELVTNFVIRIIGKAEKIITKADIGQPTDFDHRSHVGFDPNTGFEIVNVDRPMRQFFDKDRIGTDKNNPSSRLLPDNYKPALKRPPLNGTPPPPLPSTPRPPSPPLSNVQPSQPIKPPPMPRDPILLHSPPTNGIHKSSRIGDDDARSALMKDIQRGTILKPVKPDSIKTRLDKNSIGELPKRVQPDAKPHNSNGLAAALARIAQSVQESDDSDDSDTSDSGENWDD